MSRNRYRFKGRFIQAAAVSLLFSVAAAGCAGRQTEEKAGGEEVSIPVILIVDSSTTYAVILIRANANTPLNECMMESGRRMWSGSWRRRKSTGRT